MPDPDSNNPRSTAPGSDMSRSDLGSEMNKAKGAASDAASAIGEQASATARDAKDKVTTVAADVASDLKSRAREISDTITTQATTYAGQARDTVADEVGSVASALRSAADEMRSGSAAERTFSQIADGLADASEAMRDKDLGQIVNTLTEFARRNPMLTMGGAALLGFAATRFAKASSDHAATGGSMGGSSQGTYGGYNNPGRATGKAGRSGGMGSASMDTAGAGSSGMGGATGLGGGAGAGTGTGGTTGSRTSSTEAAEARMRSDDE